MLELLQNKDKGKIIIVSSGSFYIAIGKDAVLLHKEIGLKANCMEKEICKVGFPLNSLEKYTKLIEEKKYSYIVYNFDSKIEKLEKIKEYQGKKENNIKEENLNCYICKNTIKMYKKHDKYIQAVANLYEEEENKQGVNFCGYKINEYRLKIRDKGKRKLKQKVKKLKKEIKAGKITSKEAKKYLVGYIGYIRIANVNNLTKKIFYIEK